MNFFPRALPRALLRLPLAGTAATERFLRMMPRPGPATTHAAAPGTVVTRHFGNAAGSRDYKLFIPARPSAPGLIVMLHGCTQTADDFAAGTRMNDAAGAAGWFVAYPQQPSGANAQKCWNWFRPGDQRRDAGEPSILAGIARAVVQDHAIDRSRVYVAGLSAGGAAAAVLAQAYPDVFAAAGIHSGLACGAAHDLPSALAAMRAGASPAKPGRRIPVIVFQGDRDTTVHPDNAQRVLDATVAGTATARSEAGRIAGGHAYTRETYLDDGGATLAERWTVHGAGHAWSGGSAQGTYTDPRGPDATAAMLRFFQGRAGLQTG